MFSMFRWCTRFLFDLSCLSVARKWTFELDVYHPSPSAAQHPVDEPAFASIMTHGHAKDVCASELGPPRI